MAKKKAVVKGGIFLTRHRHNGKPCIAVSIRSDNGNKLASMGGYNSRQSAEKGIIALVHALRKACVIGDSAVEVYATDLTKPVKKAAKPTSK